MKSSELNKEEILKNHLLKAESEAMRMSVVRMFVEKYPNDQDLGKAIREFTNNKK